MLRVTPFLLFDGNCAEAMEFYRHCFGGSLTLTRLGDTPMSAQFAPEQHRKIVNARLKSDTVEFSATDWLHPARKPREGNTTAILVTGTGREELKPVFEKLRLGGDPELLVELRDMSFGNYGRLTDRYGVEWFFGGGS